MFISSIKLSSLIIFFISSSSKLNFFLIYTLKVNIIRNNIFEKFDPSEGVSFLKYGIHNLIFLLNP